MKVQTRVMQRYKKIELVKAVQELEKQGWECVCPIKEVVNHSTIPSRDPRQTMAMNSNQKHKGLIHRMNTNDSLKYVVKMRFVGNENHDG